PAHTHLEYALALCDPRGHATLPTTPEEMRHHRRIYLHQMGRALCVLGYPDQAVQWDQEGLTIAHALSHPHALVDSLYVSALIQGARRAWPTVQAHAEAILALAPEHGFARHVALGVSLRGMALAGQGRCVEGLTQMRQGLAAVRATGTAAGMPG